MFQQTHTLGCTCTDCPTNISTRILYVVHTTSSALQWSCLACAVLERLLAISMPSCYFSASWIIAPTLVSAPWVYYAYRLVLSVSLSERVFLVSILPSFYSSLTLLCLTSKQSFADNTRSLSLNFRCL